MNIHAHFFEPIIKRGEQLISTVISDETYMSLFAGVTVPNLENGHSKESSSQFDKFLVWQVFSSTTFQSENKLHVSFQYVSIHVRNQSFWKSLTFDFAVNTRFFIDYINLLLHYITYIDNPTCWMTRITTKFWDAGKVQGITVPDIPKLGL